MKKIEKFITFILIVLTSFNFIFPNYAIAYTKEPPLGDNYSLKTENEEETKWINEIKRKNFK